MQNTHPKTIKSNDSMATVAFILGTSLIAISIWEMAKKVLKESKKSKEPERFYDGEDIYNH